MYVGLVKLYEDHEYVEYRVETDVIEGPYKKSEKKEIFLNKKIYAYCVFNKLTAEIEWDLKKSNRRFNTAELSKQKMHAHVRLRRFYHNQEEYPLSTSVETAG